MPLVEGRWVGRRKDPAPKCEPKPKTPAMRVVEVYSGIGLGIGLAAGGMRIVQGFDVGLTRDILVRSGVDVREMSGLATVADTIRLARADVIAGYLLTERQASDLMYLAGMTHTEWIIAISPARRVSDIRPMLWQYGYGLTSLRCRGSAFGSGDGGEYDITIARFLDRDRTLEAQLAKRQTNGRLKIPQHLLEASSVDRIAAKKGFPRDIVLEQTESVLGVVESACPTVLAYHVAQAVIALHDGEDMQLPARPVFDDFIVASRSDPDPDSEDKKKKKPLKDRSLANYFPRLERARELLRGRTYRREADERAALAVAAKEFNTWLAAQNPRPPKVNPISQEVLSDYVSSLRWDRKLWVHTHPCDRKEPTPLTGEKPKRRAAPSWTRFSFSERFIPPAPRLRDGRLNFNIGQQDDEPWAPDLGDDDGAPDPYEVDKYGRLRLPSKKRGRPPGSRNRPKAKPKT